MAKAIQKKIINKKKIFDPKYTHFKLVQKSRKSLAFYQYIRDKISKGWTFCEDPSLEYMYGDDLPCWHNKEEKFDFWLVRNKLGDIPEEVSRYYLHEDFIYLPDLYNIMHWHDIQRLFDFQEKRLIYQPFKIFDEEQ